MKTFVSLSLVALRASFALADATFHSPINQLAKRGLLTCQQTYGGGSATCGGIGSHFCYDPTLGEECCPLDSGYCKQGDYCAPVMGYCCHDGEELATCAARLSFAVPLALNNSSVAIPSSALATVTTVTQAPSTLIIKIAAATPSGGALVVVSETGAVVAAATKILSGGALLVDTSKTSAVVAATAISSEAALVVDTSMINAVVAAATKTSLLGGMTPEFTAPANLLNTTGNSNPIQFTGAAGREGKVRFSAVVVGLVGLALVF